MLLIYILNNPAQMWRICDLRNCNVPYAGISKRTYGAL